MKRHATATWRGAYRAGEGTISTISGVFNNAIYTDGSANMGVPCTNPAEILAAAEASCISMMVAKELAKEMIISEHIETTSEIMLAPDHESWHIPRIHVTVKVRIPETDAAKFQAAVNRAKENCPITRSLKSQVTLEAIMEAVAVTV
jgi:lipoyl-dependent peroxiredoxin